MVPALDFRPAPRDPVVDLASDLEGALARAIGVATGTIRYQPHTLTRWTPNAGPQESFFSCTADECLYGGAAGGGKSAAEVALPLRWCNHPRFRALILRRETTQLQDLLDKAAALYPLEYPGVHWRGDELTYTFPSGAVVRFGHCKDEDDWEKYAGHEYHLVEFDEQTHFLLKQYREISKRVRSAVTELPRYVRGATNPGGVGHAWCFARWAPWLEPGRQLDDFEVEVLDAHGKRRTVRGTGLPPRVPDLARTVEGSQGARYEVKRLAGAWSCSCPDSTYRGHERPCKHVERVREEARDDALPPAAGGVVLWVVPTAQGERFSSTPVEGYPTRTFIPAKLTDNPKLVEADPLYAQKLLDNDPVRVAQLLHGNWLVKPAKGLYFKREWFEIVDESPLDGACARVWDLAATEATADSPDPDWTVGLLGSKSLDGFLYVEHMERFRAGPGAVRARIRATAEADGVEVPVRLPQDPGQAGKDQAAQYVQLLEVFDVRTRPVTGSKMVRASGASAQASPQSTGGAKGRIRVVKGPWNEEFFAELEEFPECAHDDVVDALSDLVAELASGGDSVSVGVTVVG